MASAMSRVWRIRSLGINVKRMIYEGIVMPTVLYGAETWALNAREKRILNVMEMKCLQTNCDMTEIGSEMKKLEEEQEYKLICQEEQRGVPRGGLDISSK